MSVSSNDYHGLWRASANEGVPYSEDFPEALLVLPEFIDGALGAGNASIIDITVDITNPKECELIINDNGKGLVSEKRMKEWSSKDIGNNKTENVYGHGSKKALTKFCPEFNNAKWSLYWRKQDKNGCISVLNILSSPFNGLDTKHSDDVENEEICPSHGTCWKIIFNISVLGKINNIQDIMSAIQEIIRVRYEPSYYQEYTITVKVINGASKLEKKSTDWKSLKECLEAELKSKKVKNICKIEKTLDKTTASFSLYEIVEDGRVYKIPDMPTFGKKNMNASRIHIARNGRYIEAMPYSKFMGKEYHNSDNGKIGFIIFTGEELPTPCTTKVKMQEECPIFKKMTSFIIKHINKIPKEIPAPPPEPVAVIAKAPAKNIVVKKNKETTIKEPSVVVQEKPVLALAPAPILVKEKPVVAPAPIVINKKPVVAPAPIVIKEKPNINMLIIEKDDLTIELDDCNILEKLYSKYGYKLLIEKLNEINK